MANNITLNSLKEDAIQVYNGMITVFPQFSTEKTLNISEMVPKFNGCYAMNNSTVCFISENKAYVIPYTRNVMNVLHSEGFKKEYFYVPFSNWDFPKSEPSKWENLKERARETYKQEFVDDCISFCDENNIGSISEETLQNCFEMPSTGVEVKHPYFENCYFPIINSNSFDCVAADKIGHFCTNNGKVVFVYRNGKTYVAKSSKVVKELIEAGYRECSDFFVPFSNWEVILDPVLRKRWETITKA